MGKREMTPDGGCKAGCWRGSIIPDLFRCMIESCAMSLTYDRTKKDQAAQSGKLGKSMILSRKNGEEFQSQEVQKATCESGTPPCQHRRGMCMHAFMFVGKSDRFQTTCVSSTTPPNPHNLPLHKPQM